MNKFTGVWRMLKISRSIDKNVLTALFISALAIASTEAIIRALSLF